MEEGGLKGELRGLGVGDSQCEVTGGGRGIFTPLLLQKHPTLSFQMAFLSPLHPLSLSIVILFLRGLYGDS